MLTKGEKPLLFLTLILLISVNVYISCKIVPTHEGFLKKAIKAVSKSVIKPITDIFTKKIPQMFVNLLIKAPIKAIPHKGLKDFFLENVVFDKGLPRAIMSLMWAFVVAIFILLVMVPVITFMMIPFVISVMKLLMIHGVKGFIRLFHVDTSSKMMNMAKQVFKKGDSENGEGVKNPLINLNLPNIETTGENPYEKNIKNLNNYENVQTNQSNSNVQQTNNKKKTQKTNNMTKYMPSYRTSNYSRDPRNMFRMGPGDRNAVSSLSNFTSGFSNFTGM